MSRKVNIYDAKTHLSQLVQDAADGEEIVIAKAGRPLAKLVPYRPPEVARQPGSWRGRVRIAPDFDALPADVAAAFRGDAP